MKHESKVNKMQYMYARDSKGKVRVFMLEVVKFDEHQEIHRKSGLLNGKLTPQPIITILKGKVKRSIAEQTELEARSLINKQKDKGYKLFDELVPATEQATTNPMDYKVMDELLGAVKSDSSGNRKPMLAKDVTGKPASYYNKSWWVSRKLDGVRAYVTFNQEGRIISASRGGKNFDYAMKHILSNDKLKTLLEAIGEDGILDGELYIHGRPLQYISGAARVEDSERNSELEFWIFDYGHPTHTAKERCERLNSIAGNFNADVDKIRVCKHFEADNHGDVKQLHDIWVEEGYEGAICRDATKTYGYGSRDDRMIKIKEFQDDEFEIIGMKEGLRPEDMCFKCITADGKEFEAKPVGVRALKFEYIRNIENIIGKMLTVKFFNYTPDGIPFLPIGKVIRDYE